MVFEFSSRAIRLASLLLLLATLLFVTVVITRVDDGDGLLEPLRERWVFGIPWGTILVIVGVFLFYHVIQGGGEDGPVVVGFRSWSLWYPQGLFFSPFAHASDSHLASNLLGTLAFAPIVEYVWGHRARADNLIDSRFTSPHVRIGVFVGATIGVGLLNSLFVPGAVIGFSTVVFAFAGFALLTKPLVTVFAMLGIQVVRLLREALLNPLVVAEARTRFISPSWADTALQGHLFGLLIGVLLAVTLIQFREDTPRLLYVFFAALVFAVTRSMYAIYWYLGTDVFVMFQALGAAAVFLLATLIALAVLTPAQFTIPRTTISVRSVALGCLIIAVLGVGVFGIAYNLVALSGGEYDNAIEVRDYQVTYVDGAEDQYIAGLTIPGIDPPSVSASGVIVVSEDRNAWHVARSSNNLAFHGEATVPVGDAFWRETVTINRTAWSMVDGNETYTVYGQRDGAQWQVLYTAPPAVSDKRLRHSNVSIHPSGTWYKIKVERNDTLVGSEHIPASNDSVQIGEITFERDGPDLVASFNGTEVRVAEFILQERG